MEFHRIWRQQCAATETIKDEHGIENALAYLIGEKLMNFVAASEEHPEFAQDLSEFAAEIRRIFPPEEIAGYLDQFERCKIIEPLPEQAEDHEAEACDDLLHDPVSTAEEIMRFARVRALLQPSGSG